MASGLTQGIRGNWNCILAALLMTLYPFQYGLDFGLIGGLQAMKGFLKVSLPTQSIFAAFSLKLPTRSLVMKTQMFPPDGILVPNASSSSRP